MTNSRRTPNHKTFSLSFAAVLPLCLGLVLGACDLEGYDLIREIADGDGSNDTISESSPDTDATEVTEGETSTGPVSDSESASPADTGTPDSDIVDEAETGSDVDTALDRDTESSAIPSTDSTGDSPEEADGDSENPCVCVCDCPCEDDTDTGVEDTDEDDVADSDGVSPDTADGVSTEGDAPDVDTGARDRDSETGAADDTSADADSEADSEIGADAAVSVPDTSNDDTGADPNDASSCLVISEYVEGSSRNKGVEIFNCGTDAVDLSEVSLCLISNDNTTCGTTLTLEGVLMDGAVMTICHTSADLIGPCDVRSGVVNFSGDDRLVLSDGFGTLDGFGVPDVRPEGTPWADVTLRRCNLSPFDGVGAFVVEDFYTAFPVDEFDDFGFAPTESSCGE